MAGRRLLDAAKLFNATRSIAKQHVALRSHQLDVFTRTSTVAKAVKNQTDRVTVTARAAIALAQRFNEPPPPYTKEASAEQPKPQDETIPRKSTVNDNAGTRSAGSGLEQDHHYDTSEHNAARQPPPKDELGVNQRQADREPLPDGSIPPANSKLRWGTEKHDFFSQRPIAEPAKRPLSVQDQFAREELDITQKQAERRPLPDGTIPPADVDLRSGSERQDTFSQRPVPEPTKGPLANEDQFARSESLRPAASSASTIPTPGKASMTADHAREIQREAESQIPSKAADLEGNLTIDLDNDVFHKREGHTSYEFSNLPRTKLPKISADTQGSKDEVDDGGINAEVFYTSKGQESQETVPTQQAVPEQDEIPEGVNTDVFRTSRVSRMLGVPKPGDRRPSGLELKGAARTPVEHTKLAQGHDQDTFNVRTSEANAPAAPSPAAQTEAGKSFQNADQDLRSLASDIAKEANAPSSESEILVGPDNEVVVYQLRESRVPSSRLGRIWNYGTLGASMAFGAVGESLKRVTGAASAGGSLMLSAGNMERLVAKLSRMRGAALKLGQIISFQDIKMLPPPIHEVLQRVQDSADYMPASQRDKVLVANLGPDWRDLFTSFEEVPIAAASIGQVHKAVLKSTGMPVAVKVQYPGVANSIDSDLSNLSLLLTASRVLPRGLFLDKTIANARTELGWECDYIREAECQKRFSELLADDTETFTVPTIVPEACGKEVLTAELMTGKAITKLPSLSQEERDWIGTQILRLCFRELVEFHFMQTDPNWTNFLYNAKDKKLELLDFGASREYPTRFTDPYIRILIAASRNDRDTIRDLSLELGYLTGDEGKTMLDAHVDSVLTLAEPFKENGPEVYDFSDQTITDRVRSFIPVMVRERLSPPPEETYSLHRKLSGAFLLCARLESRIACKKLFQDAVAKYERRT
ncbi:uncharacterized protein K452DRAFT_269360 [Aplosporella prunicola CBS 121167]|uniref:ABC1 atypical kinase-like domain-containing protein n=1 Tax=Aplosporella prunicola CBS 121167 TaxID=1176127 RepID=A0A6A6BJ69_9PEZI|nr:uncharacterized protein K452DRAFT_269360 [Aplosporella prunicola CBS 121167]KAF2142857.1 hypothetical protein K452DRAFT_269360 [Aplosporella prunicola CBS 121167]